MSSDYEKWLLSESNLAFEIYRDSQGQFRWKLKSGNHRIIANCVEGYKNRRDLEDAIALVQNSASAEIKG